jgi:hypothetical protein
MIVRADHFEFNRQRMRDIQELATDQTLTDDQKELVRELGTDRPFFTDAPSFCFFCGEKLTIPAVMWCGLSGDKFGDPMQIWLHPKCAEQLCARIQRDVNESKVGTKRADDELEAWKRDHPI